MIALVVIAAVLFFLAAVVIPAIAIALAWPATATAVIGAVSYEVWIWRHHHD